MRSLSLSHLNQSAILMMPKLWWNHLFHLKLLELWILAPLNWDWNKDADNRSNIYPVYLHGLPNNSYNNDDDTRQLNDIFGPFLGYIFPSRSSALSSAPPRIVPTITRYSDISITLINSPTFVPSISSVNSSAHSFGHPLDTAAPSLGHFVYLPRISFCQLNALQLRSNLRSPPDCCEPTVERLTINLPSSYHGRLSRQSTQSYAADDLHSHMQERLIQHHDTNRTGNRQSDLNTLFSWILPNVSSLFIVDDDGVETLRPDPIPVLKSLIVAAIMDELPPSEVSKAHKCHISSLIAKTTIFWHSKAIGGRIRVRDKQVLDIAAKHAKRGHPIINLVLHTIHWKFHKDWYPYEFHKVSTTATGIPSDETGLSVKPPSQSRLVNIQKCEQILQTHYSQAVFGKDKTTKTLPPKRTHQRKSPITAPNPTDTNADTIASTPHSMASVSPTTADLLPVQATD
eukprot:jgi/Psemu1/47585/gm1.47585_g